MTWTVASEDIDCDTTHVQTTAMSASYYYTIAYMNIWHGARTRTRSSMYRGPNFRKTQ